MCIDCHAECVLCNPVALSLFRQACTRFLPRLMARLITVLSNHELSLQFDQTREWDNSPCIPSIRSRIVFISLTSTAYRISS